MEREELKEFMPHREPMLLLDEATLDENGVAHARYTVRGDEFFLQGHFPGYPVVPGVILCEMMAQSCCIIIREEVIGKTTLYSGIDKLRFRRPVRPGETVELESKITNRRGPYFFVEAKATVNGELCTSGNLSFALIPKENAEGGKK